jgi:hypothetical protein
MVFSKLIKSSSASWRRLGGLLLLLLCAANVQAQSFSFSDLFGQSGKLLKNMEQQIAALTAFESSVKQGYNMLHSEWSMIGNFKDGELTLHQTYYTSLSQVNPLVKNSTDLPAIQSEQQSIISQFNAIAGVAGLTTDEQSYIRLVGQNIINECNSDLTDLQNVLTAGVLVMSDDERIKRISKISTAIKDKYVFACTFCTQVRVLAAQHNGDGGDNSEVGNLFGIHP